jgi:hypothetical protein
MGMSQGDQASSEGAQGEDWRVQLREMRTWRALCADAPAEDATARISDRDLRAAAQNPDHSEAGRAAAEAELRARRLNADPWRIAVPGFIKREDLEKKGARLFFGAGRTVRAWSGWIFFLVFAGILIAAAWAQTRYYTIGISDDVAGALGIAFLAPLIIWFIATALRRKPARILLLRKFNERHVSDPLERMLTQELRPYGHVASLSDKYIKRDTFGWLGTAALSLSNPLAAIWFVIGMPIRFVWRLFDRSAMGPAVVLNARDYRNLAKRLRDRIGLNIQVATTSKEAFLVRTSDAWWQMVVHLLMDSSDALVVDLSQVSSGTEWELDVIREEQTQARCVFVSIWGRAEEAEALLRARGFENTCFYYAPDGEMQRRPQFRAAMLAAMRA